VKSNRKEKVTQEATPKKYETMTRGGGKVKKRKNIDPRQTTVNPPERRDRRREAKREHDYFRSPEKLQTASFQRRRENREETTPSRGKKG